MAARIDYRIARPTDAQAIAEQGKQAFVEAFGSVYAPPEVQGYFAQTYGGGMQDQEINDPAVYLLVAEDEQGIFGHIKVGPCALPVKVDEPSAEIKRFYLLARSHGTGVASAMLMAAIEWARARNAAALYLSCWTDNQKGLRFYMRNGFTIVGRQQFAVGARIDDDHILRMAL